MATSLSSQLGQRVQLRVPVAAALGQIFAGDDAQAGGDDLHEDGHQAGKADDPEQSVFELGAALQVGAPIAGVHVADADQDGRADKGAPLLPESGLMMWDRDATVHALERDLAMGRRFRIYGVRDGRAAWARLHGRLSVQLGCVCRLGVRSRADLNHRIDCRVNWR